MMVTIAEELYLANGECSDRKKLDPTTMLEATTPVPRVTASLMGNACPAQNTNTRA